MTDLVYDEMVGWYDPDIAYCTRDGCHEEAYTYEMKGTVDVSIDEDDMCFITYAVCEKHSPHKEM